MAAKNLTEFIQNITTLGLREDGREMLDMRNLRILFNQAFDGCEVSLGKTKVFAKVSAKITEPALSKPNEGIIKFNINLKLAHESAQNFTNMKRMELTNELSKYLERNIKGSRALDCESLCILTGNYAWNITCELSLLHNDGNLLDAFSYAAIISLFRFRLPFVSVELGKIKVHSFEEKRPQTLSIHHFPISMTFSVATLKNEGGEEFEYIVFDPSKSEEESLDGRISLTLNVYKDICGIHFPGGCNVKGSLIKEMLKFAERRVVDITEMLRDFLRREESNTLTIYQEAGRLIVKMENLGQGTKPDERSESSDGEREDMEEPNPVVR